MFRFFRTLCTWVGFLVFFLVIIYGIRDSLSRKLMEWSAYQLTSFPLFISENKIPSHWPLKLISHNLLLKNPVDFPHPQAALLSQMELQFAEKPWDQSPPQIAKLSLTIDELVLVKTSNAGHNFSRLIQTSQNASSLFNAVRVQQFQFSINQILYYDYTKTSTPMPLTYPLQGQWLRYETPVTLKQIPALVLDYANQQIIFPANESAL